MTICVELKAGPGRGRKTMSWCSWLYPIVCEDFKRLRAVGLKFSPRVLQLVAKNALLNSAHTLFHHNTRPNEDPCPLIERITTRWVQQF